MLCTLFRYISIILSILQFATIQGQIPVDMEVGTSCIPDSSYYLNELGVQPNELDQFEVFIETLDSSICIPQTSDFSSSDLSGGVWPYFHPNSGILMGEVAQMPMEYELTQHVVISHNNGSEIEFTHDVFVNVLKPNSSDPLAEKFVYLAPGTSIPYNEIHNALSNGIVDDFTDLCGNGYNLSSLNTDNEPAVTNIYPWGNGTRVELYWLVEPIGSELIWYIQHIFIGSEPWDLICEPLSDETINIDLCMLDNQPPTIIDAPEDQTLNCDEPIPPPFWPVAVDDFGEVTIGLEEYYESGDCPSDGSIERLYIIGDECGWSIELAVSISIVDEIAPVPTDLPSDLISVPADSILEDPVNYIAIDNCSEENITPIVSASYNANTGTIGLEYFDECGNQTQYTYTVESSPPDFLADLDSEISIPIGTGLPDPVEIDAFNSHNNYFDFGLTEYILPSANGEDCIAYTVIREYETINGDGEVIDDFTFTQEINLMDSEPPTLSIGADTTVNSIDSIPELEFEASDVGILDTVIVSNDTIPGECAANFTLARTYTAIDNCDNQTQSTQTIIVDGDCSTSTLSAHVINENLSLFPNPVENILFFNSAVNGPIRIFNTLGQLIYQDLSNFPKTQIQVSELPPGIYSVLIDQTKRTIIVRRK